MSRVLEYLPVMAKALVAGALALSGAYAGALDGGVTVEEWVVVLAAGVAAAVGTWWKKNKPATAG